MNTCYIVGGGDFDGFFDKIDESDFIIGADKGYLNLFNENIKADLVIGDFDSSKEPIFSNIIKLKPEKDMTDTYAAIEIGIKKGYKTFVIYGALGGRLSHTIANINILMEFKKIGIEIILKSKKQKVFLINDHFKYKFNDENNFYVSIFSLFKISKGVSIKGLKYEVMDIDLLDCNHLGVSNETVSSDFEISVKNGCLLIIFESFDIN